MSEEQAVRTLYFGGPILTMEEGGRYAEAVLTEGKRILAVGELKALRQMAGEGARMKDLKGRTMMPAFIDAHSHFTACANSFLEADLEGAASFEEIGTRLRDFIRDRQIPKGQWVRGGKYDQNQLKEGRHPDRAFLDKACPDHPVVISHQSGHMGVFNTAALKLLGVTARTQAPQGGVIALEKGEPTGYMEESAFVKWQQEVPLPSQEDFLEAYRRAQELYLSKGVTTVQEGMMTRQVGRLYGLLLSGNLLKVDVVAYADMRESPGLMEEFGEYGDGYRNHFRMGGYKMFLDGSPQGRTAWLREPYMPAVPENPREGEGYRGYPVLTDEEVYRNVKTAVLQGRQLLTHCNGDAACGQLLAQCRRVEEETGKLAAIRPVMIHAQLLGLDQLEEVKRLGMIPSFFAAHVYHWGDVHVKNLGMERAKSISPAASALKRQILFTFHQDSPVIQPDMMETIWCAVCRKTKKDLALGIQERIPVYQALKAVTINSAYQYFEESSKGSIRPGKLADLVILEENPLEAEPERLRQIRVMETIKEGETVYQVFSSAVFQSTSKAPSDFKSSTRA